MALNMTMRAVIWAGVPFQVNVTDVPRPVLQSPTDAIVRITTSAICGSDLHVYHGVWGSSDVPYIMGHEAIGVVSEIGEGVEQFSVGDKVIIPDAVQDGQVAGGSHVAFGLGAEYGLSVGLQAEYARVPWADGNLMAIPQTNSTNSTSLDDDYLLVGDIWATAWEALDYSGFEPGDTVAVFGAGPVGLLAAYSAILRGASRVFSVDRISARLELARSIGAVPINFAESDPVQQILQIEPQGVTRSVDCIGAEAVDAQGRPSENEVINNMVAVTAQRGGIGQIGVFTTATNSTGTPRAGVLSHSIQFPMADFFNKGLSMRSGPVDIEPVAPNLINLIATGVARPSFIVSSHISIEDAPEYYEQFDQHIGTKVYITLPDAHSQL